MPKNMDVRKRKKHGWTDVGVQNAAERLSHPLRQGCVYIATRLFEGGKIERVGGFDEGGKIERVGGFDEGGKIERVGGFDSVAGRCMYRAYRTLFSEMMLQHKTGIHRAESSNKGGA